jgi:transcriptional regulator with XRE-family HTH domain
MGQTFGQILREKRIAAGHSVRQAAKLIGISPSYLSRLENEPGMRPPSEKVIRAFSFVYAADRHEEMMRAAGRIESWIQIRFEEDPELRGLMSEMDRRNMTAADVIAILRDSE